MIDYGYCQSEICWGDSWMTADRVLKVVEGIVAAGGSRIRIGVQVGTEADLDRAINAATGVGLKVLMCIISNPLFGYDGTPAGYAKQCTYLAKRYGPAGTNQVSEYEILNESNQNTNAPNVSSAEAYTQFLKAGYTAIKAVHSSSTVICGGAVPAPTSPFAVPIPILTFPFFMLASAIDPVSWYKGIYAAGGRDYMDALATHLYADTETPSPTMRQWAYIPQIRQLMLDNGDAAKKIWVTEVGTSNPGPGIDNPITERDWLKLMVEGIESYSYTGPFFIYNFVNSTNDPTDSSLGNYGIVDFNFQPKSPKYQYAQTIRGADSGDHTPPTPPPTVACNSVTDSSAVVLWEKASDDVGVTVYRVYLADGTKMTETVSLTTTLVGLTPGKDFDGYVTAVDAAGHESAPSPHFTFTTSAPLGAQGFYSYDYGASGSTTPTTFVQLGLGYHVIGGVALPNVPTVEGDYWTVAPFSRDLESADQFAEIRQSVASLAPDRGAFAIVKGSPDGQQGVGAILYGGGKTDACRLFTLNAGAPTYQDSANATPLLPNETLRITAKGNVYTVARFTAGNMSAELLEWTDLNGTYASPTNRRPGHGWRHKLSGGIYYPPPGITGVWRGADVAAVVAGGAAEVWELAAVQSRHRARLIATGGDWLPVK